MFNPQYKLTNSILSDITTIAEAKAVIERAKLLPKQELRLRQQALIRMTHASTKIEGNALNIHQVEAIVERKKIDAPARDIFEVQNYLNALRYISKIVKNKKPITEKVILNVHRLVTENTLPTEQSGRYRKTLVYVVKRRSRLPQEVIYTAPNAKRVPALMKNLVTWLVESGKREIHPVIAAGIVHAEIAAIHPFTDGNGRAARALATLVLYMRGYDFRRLFALEDYYNRERPKYYAAIDMGKTYDGRKTDLTRWLEYFVQGFKEDILNVKKKVVALQFVKTNGNLESQIYLDKEQMLILDSLEKLGKITVHDVMKILERPQRTAQWHLKRLKKVHVIEQKGKGRASFYILVK